MVCALQVAFWPGTARKPITSKLTDKLERVLNAE